MVAALIWDERGGVSAMNSDSEKQPKNDSVECSKAASAGDPRTESYVEAVKLLGTGNSTGFFGALVALYYFGSKWPDVAVWIMGTAAAYLVGICLFAVTFQLLTIFSIRQTDTVRDVPGLERLRQWVVRLGVASLVAWWIGTAVTVGALGMIYCTPPVSVGPTR